jgi:hypothetical protein
MLVGVNYFIDSRNLFTAGKYEKSIAQALLRGNCVANAYNFDVRLLRRYMAEGQDSLPQTLVLGGSRQMLIDTSVLPDCPKPFMNTCVQSASLEDEMALYDLYLKRGVKLKKVYIGIEAYFLNSNAKQNEYGPVRDHYYNICQKIGVPVRNKHELYFRYGNYANLFSVDYFQKSILFWINTGNNHKFIPTNTKFNPTQTYCPDGTIVFGRGDRNATPKEVSMKAEKMAEESVFYFNNFDHLSPELQEKFERFIAYIQKQGTEVNLILTPYHPIWYKKMCTDPRYKMVLQAEPYFRKFAEEKGINLYGSFSPYAYGLDQNSFFDGLHLKPQGIKKILSEPGRYCASELTVLSNKR